MTENNQYQSEPEDLPLPLTVPSRDDILLTLEEVRIDLAAKCRSNRVRDPDNEKIRLDRTRLLVYICSQMCTIMKERDLDDLQERIAALEASRVNRTSRHTHADYVRDPCTIAGGK